MIGNYFKIAIRILQKHKTYSLINILGLSVAFLCSTLLFLNATHELSYDSFYPDKEDIYKIYHYSRTIEGEEKTGSMAMPVAPTVKSNISQVEYATRFIASNSGLEYNSKKLDLQVNLTDEDFFKIFSIEILKGNKLNPLHDLGNAVVTEYAASRIFGTEDPIGKVIRIKIGGELKELTVSAVIKDFSQNSTLTYDVLVRPEIRADYPTEKDNWNNWNHDVYIKLKPNTNPEVVEAGLRDITSKYNIEDTVYMKKNGYLKDNYGHYTAFLLLPLTEVHFDAKAGANNGAISKIYIYTLLLISFSILAIACFNFINLNIARSFTRAKEVGIRKCLGAGKQQIFLQIWGESLMICLFAVLISIIAGLSVLKGFNQLFGTKLSMLYFMQPSAIIMLLVSVLLISFAAGGYPALVISRLSITSVLKGKIDIKKPGIFRNSLIVLQFTVACLLMVCTLIAYKQFQHMRNMPLGYNKESVISVPVYGINGMKGRDVIAQLRSRLASESAVTSITGSNINLGVGKDGSTSKMSRGFEYKEKGIHTNWMTVDYDFLKTLNIKLLEGRDFSREYGTDTISSVVVSESMLKQFQVTDALSLTFSTDTSRPPYRVIGVIPDFHLYSLHETTEPLTIDISSQSSVYYALIKTNGNPVNAMNLIERTFKEIAPGKEFKASFLDENTDRWYQKEQRLSILLGISAGIAIIISCLGLFALALLMIQQRVKEIGIRKVLGASVFSINKLLIRDFLMLVVIAIIIASPLAWWLMSKWLSDFPYRIQISWSVFIIVAFSAIFIALITISFNTIKAALVNPVKSLRSE